MPATWSTLGNSFNRLADGKLNVFPFTAAVH